MLVTRGTFIQYRMIGKWLGLYSYTLHIHQALENGAVLYSFSLHTDHPASASTTKNLSPYQFDDIVKLMLKTFLLFLLRIFINAASTSTIY